MRVIEIVRAKLAKIPIQKSRTLTHRILYIGTVRFLVCEKCGRSQLCEYKLETLTPKHKTRSESLRELLHPNTLSCEKHDFSYTTTSTYTGVGIHTVLISWRESGDKYTYVQRNAVAALTAAADTITKQPQQAQLNKTCELIMCLLHSKIEPDPKCAWLRYVGDAAREHMLHEIHVGVVWRSRMYCGCRPLLKCGAARWARVRVRRDWDCARCRLLVLCAAAGVLVGLSACVLALCGGGYAGRVRTIVLLVCVVLCWSVCFKSVSLCAELSCGSARHSRAATELACMVVFVLALDPTRKQYGVFECGRDRQPVRLPPFKKPLQHASTRHDTLRWHGALAFTRCGRLHCRRPRECSRDACIVRWWWIDEAMALLEHNIDNGWWWYDTRLCVNEFPCRVRCSYVCLACIGINSYTCVHKWREPSKLHCELLEVRKRSFVISTVKCQSKWIIGFERVEYPVPKYPIQFIV